MKKIICLLLCLPMPAFAEVAKGLQFDHELMWHEVRAKARAEKKFIFVDVFATWCGPCNAMSMGTFPQGKVGKAMNDKFIAIKVQTDFYPDDDEYKVKWRNDVKKIQDEYGVTGFPTYLFFSPEGRLVHRSMGYMEADAFIAVVNDAMNPEKQLFGPKYYATFYSLLERHKQVGSDIEKLADVIKIAYTVGDKAVTDSAFLEYRDKVLDKLSEVELLKPNYMKFLVYDFPDAIREQGSKGSLFNSIFKNSAHIDKMISMDNGAKNLVESIIYKEEIGDKLWIDGQPSQSQDWEAMRTSIESKYGAELAERFVWEARLRFYQRTDNAAKYVESVEKQIETYPPRLTARANEIGNIGKLSKQALWVLENTADRALLERALSWMELCKIQGGSKPDTTAALHVRARLMYKLGKTNEAIGAMEQLIAGVSAAAKRVSEAVQNERILPDKAVKPLVSTLELMKKGEPSWTEKET